MREIEINHTLIEKDERHDAFYRERNNRVIPKRDEPIQIGNIISEDEIDEGEDEEE